MDEDMAFQNPLYTFFFHFLIVYSRALSIYELGKPSRANMISLS
jgi:hypothetical protein